MNRKKILTVGDSNASNLWGKSWADFLSYNLDYDLLNAPSPGAGNSFYIEKLHTGLREFKPDLVVVQLTEPSRITTGVNVLYNEQIKDLWTDGINFRDFSCYSWNGYSNEKNINSFSNINVEIDKFWVMEVSTSKWVDYKLMQDIFTMFSLAKKHNTEIVFFSWFTPFSQLFIEPYSWLKNEIKWIDGSGMDIMNKLKQENLPCGHYSSEPHRIFTEEWLYPEIVEKLTYK